MRAGRRRWSRHLGRREGGGGGRVPAPGETFPRFRQDVYAVRDVPEKGSGRVESSRWRWVETQ